MKKIKLPINEILSLYNIDNLSCYKIAKHFNVSQGVILKYLKGIVSRSKSSRIYTIDETAFNEINEESSYWIGFLMADGNLCNKKHRIKIRLAAKDEIHLYKFKTYLKSNAPIKNYNINNKKYSEICIYNLILSEKLIHNFNIVPNKMYITEATECMRYNKHFWRGVIDGDGSISYKIMESGNYAPRISLYGSKFLLHQFKTYVQTFCNTDVTIGKDSNTYTIFFSHTNAMKIINNLYSNSTIHLDRKYKFSMELLDKYKTRFPGIV